MRTPLITIVLAFLCVPLSGAAQGPTAPPPCTSPEHRQFDFWIGEWDVKTPDGKTAGTNRIERIESGCGLQENWTGAGGGTGRSLNAYWAGDRKWHQFWIGSGLVMHLSGVYAGDSLRLEGVVVGPAGARVQHRLTFTKRGDGTVRQFWENSRDEGKTWTVAFDGVYTKRP